MKYLLFLILYISIVFSQSVPNVSQLITQQGYPCENHWVETSDGFLLSLIRIPSGKNDQTKKDQSKPIIFLQHGLLDSAATWVVNLPYQSLGFILADNGFDVWLGNIRGNYYSSQNKIYSNNSTEYWQLIDYDYMAAIDLPTMINYALSVSGESSLVYVGHSQGTLMGFAGFPENEELTSKVNLFIALAPVAYVYNVESPLLDFMADLDLALWLQFFGEESFLPDNWVSQLIGGTLCLIDPYVCEDIVFLLCGWDISNMNKTRVPIYMEHTPAGTSVRNMLHWSQGIAEGMFQKFDYGTQGNIQHYNSTTPPQYLLQKVTSPPVAIFTGTKDILADPNDVQNLVNQLPVSNKPIFTLNEPTYNHLDFVWGENAYKLIYPDVVALAKKYSSK